MKNRLKLFVVIVLYAFSHVAFAQQTAVTGKVIDQAGEEIPGVSVVLKGTTTGTITDVSGNYSLNVSGNDAVLVFSFIGLETQELVVAGQTVIDITMASSSIGLDEVVAIGYGTAKKSDLTGAIATVETKDFAKIPATSPLQVLQGRASGIQITSNSGMPGAGSSVLVRGAQSIAGSSSPIYVVDGVITTSIDNINPNNIKSVSVLKDASAAAIYGARAANGVILVSTKRGKGASKPTINVNAYYGIQNESNLKFEQLNAADFYELWTESHVNAGLDLAWDDEKAAYYEGVDTDWQSLMRQTGIIQNYDVSVSGGSEKSNYYISAGYLNQKGMIIETAFEKYTVSFNSDHKINERVRFGNSLSLFSTKTDGSDYAYRYALRKSPMSKAYDEDGDYAAIYDSNYEHIHANPIWLAKNRIEEYKTKGLQGNMYLTIDIMDGLSFTTRGSLDYTGSYDSFFSAGVPPQYGWEGTNVNTVTKNFNETVHYMGDFLLNYDKTFNDIHNVKGLLGYSVEESQTEFLYGSRTGTPNDDIRYLSAGDPTSQINENGFTDWSFASIFGRVSYAYDNKYLVSATVRRDGTSRLLGDNKYDVYPSGSVAWRISQEDFMNDIDFIDDLKVRASYGTLGNILSISEYATSASLASRQAVIDQGGASSYTLTNAVNADLKWERSEKKNIGIDVTMLNSKLYATVNGFVEDTYNQLFKDPLAPSTGLPGYPYINAGEVRNTGFELELGYRDQKGDWSYDVNANMSYVKNEVTDLGGRDLRTSGLVVGEPLKSFYGYKSDGLIKDESQLAIYEEGNFKTKQVGDIYLRDIDGYDADGKLTGVPDGKVDAADRTIIGSRYPDLLYGMMGTVSYKSWSLQVQLQGVQGIDFQTHVSGNNDVVQLMSSWARNEDGRVVDRYHETANPDGTWPRLSKDQSGSNATFSEFWLEDASYLRIKNINLNYSVPKNYAQKAGMSSLGVYVSLQNAYTFTKYSGPDVDSSSSDSYNTIPQPRTWTVGLRASF